MVIGLSRPKKEKSAEPVVPRFALSVVIGTTELLRSKAAAKHTQAEHRDTEQTDGRSAACSEAMSVRRTPAIPDSVRNSNGILLLLFLNLSATPYKLET